MRRVSSCVHSSLLRLLTCVHQVGRFSGARYVALHDCGVFQLREKLDKGFAQGWHHIGGVVERQTSNKSHGGHAVLEILIVECDEQRPDVLSLS